MQQLLMNLVFVILVSNPVQERQATVLINSLREFGGQYAQSSVYVFVENSVLTPCPGLQVEGVTLIPLDVEASLPNYPFVSKMVALAQAEQLLKGEAETLVWMDADALVLKEPGEFVLNGKKKLAIRPVNLRNNVGLPAGDAPDPYWAKIYAMTGLNAEEVPLMETFVDKQKVKNYLNCAIFSIRPDLGVLTESYQIFKSLLFDQGYQLAAISTTNHLVFLHQAVLSAVMTSKIAPDEIHWFSNGAGYPLHHQKELTADWKIENAAGLESLIYAYSWGSKRWMLHEIDIDEPLRSWLAKQYEIEYKVTDHIYREEGLCNSYLIRTDAGAVMIDPGGASDSTESILYSFGIRPEVILITHAHADHIQGIDLWKFGRDIPVIAQEKHKAFLEYNHMLASFFEVRNAVQGNVITEKTLTVHPTVFFDHDYTYELGGMHFRMIHTSGETPDQAAIWIPELKAAFIADNYYTSFPNLSPLRGSKPRWALEYIDALETVLDLEPTWFSPVTAVRLSERKK